MSAQQPFLPQGPTIMVNVSSVSTGGICPSTAGSLQAVRVHNISTGPNIFVRFSQVVTDVPVLPLSSLGSTAAYGFPIGQNQNEIFSCPPNTYVSAVSTAALMASVMAVTMGYGKK